jgi:hypothetical protein
LNAESNVESMTNQPPSIIATVYQSSDIAHRLLRMKRIATGRSSATDGVAMFFLVDDATPRLDAIY